MGDMIPNAVSCLHNQYLPSVFLAKLFVNVCLQWNSEEGGQVSELMKRQLDGDLTVMGLKFNLEAVEKYLTDQGLESQVQPFK